MKIINQIIKSLSLILIPFLSSETSGQNQINIEIYPKKPWLEKLNDKYVTNFDFKIENKSADTLKLTKILVRHLDQNDILIQQKFLDNNGTAPSINTIPSTSWNGVSQKLLFNPFPEINPATTKLEYTFTFNDQIEIKQIVTPEKYEQGIDFILPLKEKTLVYDGHDLNSHHRRFDYEFTPIKQLGFTGNFMRYAYDFAVLDKDNRQFINQGTINEEWIGFGKEVLAVADGEIVAIETNQLDNKQFDVPSLKNNPLALYGNYVVIKHKNNTLSMYAHLKNKSSLNMKKGDFIQKGQIIGLIGTSGSSFFPHLHFEVRTNIKHDAEGIPSYFSNFELYSGKTKKTLKRATVNTGDIIQSK